jgi:hypothetical protein
MTALLTSPCPCSLVGFNSRESAAATGMTGQHDATEEQQEDSCMCNMMDSAGNNVGAVCSRSDTASLGKARGDACMHCWARGGNMLD